MRDYLTAMTDFDYQRTVTGALDGHERGAGGESTGDGADEVAVQASQRVDAGEEPGGEAVGH